MAACVVAQDDVGLESQLNGSLDACDCNAVTGGWGNDVGTTGSKHAGEATGEVTLWEGAAHNREW